LTPFPRCDCFYLRRSGLFARGSRATMRSLCSPPFYPQRLVRDLLPLSPSSGIPHEATRSLNPPSFADAAGQGCGPVVAAPLDDHQGRGGRGRGNRCSSATPAVNRKGSRYARKRQRCDELPSFQRGAHRNDGPERARTDCGEVPNSRCCSSTILSGPIRRR